MKDENGFERFYALRQILRLVAIHEQAVKFAGLRIRFADDHAGHLRTILLYAELAHIGKDVVEKSIEVIWMLDDLVLFDV